MKTKMTINSEVFGNKSVEESFEYYKKYYKKDDFIFDEENEDCYKIFDRKLKLKVGDEVLFYGLQKVEWKVYDFFNDTMEYSLVEA